MRSSPRHASLISLVLTFAFIFTALCTAPAVAQFANADLAGVVSDPDGAPLPGVTVTALSDSTGQSRITVSSANGAYAINGLQPGAYSVSFQLEGFQNRTVPNVQLRVGQETRLNATLQIGAIEETLTVTGEAPTVEVTSKEIGGTLTTQEFESLPTQNRSALLFAALLPGVIPSPSTESTASDALFINGQDDNNNSFNFDGANNDDDVIGARAGAQARVPMEAVQEFQVLTTQFDAEFGRAVGGVLNAVTKSGGNRFAGTVFAFVQDSSLNDENFFIERNNLEQPKTEYRSTGFVVGGPIVRNKAFFFVSYEDNLNEEGIVGSFPTRPDLNFSTTEDNDIENQLVKVSYHPTQGHTLAARYLLEESPQFNQIIGNVTLDASREEDDTDSNWIASWDSVWGSRAINTARVSFTKEDVSFANPGFNNNGQDFDAQRNQAPREDHPGFIGGASDVAQSRFNRSFQVDDTFSYFVPDWKGEHELRVGFQYSDREEEFTNFGALNGVFFNFDNDRPFDADDITTYPGSFTLRVLGGQTAEIPNNETLGLFVQDDWRIGENLTLNLGLRWDEEDITDDSDNYAPRVGFAWDPFGQGKTVVRGGAGRFYDRFQLGFFASFFLDAINVPQGFLVRLPDAGENRELFFQIAQDNGVTSLVELRDVLAAQLEQGAGPVINTQPTVDNPNRVQAYADTISLGAEHEIFPGISASVDLVRTESNDVPLLVDLNPFSDSLGGRPDISVFNGQQVELGSVSTWVNAGDNVYNAVQLALAKRSGLRWTGRVGYTYADSEGNQEGGGAGTASAYFQRRTETGYDFDRGVFLGAPLDLGLDDPRTRDIPVNWHRDHNFVVSGTYRVPGTSWRENGGLVVAGLYRFMTGDQITLLANSDRLDNGNRAPADAGNFDATQDSDIAENGTSFNGKLQGAENPDFSRLDLSLRYTVPFTGRYLVKLQADIFNVFDETNFASLGGNRVGTGTFLTPTSAFNPREFQLGVKFEF